MRSGDAEVFCDGCAPKDSDGVPDGAEADAPQHCAACGAFLDGFSMTSEGMKYVARAAVRFVSGGGGNPLIVKEWCDRYGVDVGHVIDAADEVPPGMLRARWDSVSSGDEVYYLNYSTIEGPYRVGDPTRRTLWGKTGRRTDFGENLLRKDERPRP